MKGYLKIQFSTASEKPRVDYHWEGTLGVEGQIEAHNAKTKQISNSKNNRDSLKNIFSDLDQNY